MKIIFFDVDGILTYTNSGSENNGIDKSRVALLKKIVEKTDAKLVIISSWKGYFLDDETFWRPSIYKNLEDILNEYGLSIYGETLFIKRNSERNKHYETRAAEVYNWLKEHDNVKSFVILDDEDHDWSFFGYDKYWIRPSYFEKDGGLHPEHVKKAIEILNR